MKTTATMNKFSLKQQYQTGLTLLELMVAMAIGVFLLAGLIQIFINTKKSFNVQDAVARIEENSRFSLETLGRNIRLAGYRTDPWQNASIAFPNTTATLFNNNPGQIISGTDGGTQSDQINIQYHGSEGGRMLDCAGESVEEDELVELSFSLDGSELKCISTIYQTPPPTVIVSDEIIADNIINMQIVYGEDSTNDGTANKYIDASSVSNWNNVISIKIGLVVSSSDEPDSSKNLTSKALSFPDISDNPMNAMFDIDADGEPELFKSSDSSDFDTQTAPDKRLYKIYTTTIALRNRVL